MDVKVREINPILSVNQLVEVFQISRNTVYREIQNGLPFITVGKNKRFVYAEVLEYFKRK